MQFDSPPKPQYPSGLRGSSHENRRPVRRPPVRVAEPVVRVLLLLGQVVIFVERLTRVCPPPWMPSVTVVPHVQIRVVPCNLQPILGGVGRVVVRPNNPSMTGRVGMKSKARTDQTTANMMTLSNHCATAIL